MSISQQSCNPSYNVCIPCLLLTDTSGSMVGSKIECLNRGIDRLIVELSSLIEKIKEWNSKTDESGCKSPLCIDIGIIEFNTHAKVVQEFAPICWIPKIRLEADEIMTTEETAMGEGIELALNKVQERGQLYDSLGTPCFKPWIFMITDGAPTDDISNAQARIAEREGKGKLKFWALGVPGYDEAVLKSLSPHVQALDDADISDFTGILADYYDWCD